MCRPPGALNATAQKKCAPRRNSGTPFSPASTLARPSSPDSTSPRAVSLPERLLERRELLLVQLAQPFLRQLDHPGQLHGRERPLLGRALHLEQLARRVADHVHVDLGGEVLLVIEV